MGQLFDHLQANEAGTDDHCPLARNRADRGLNGIRVRHVAQRKDIRRVNAIERRDNRTGTWRENELAIGLLVNGAGDMVAHRNRFTSPIDGDHFLFCAYIEPKASAQKFRRRDQ